MTAYFKCTAAAILISLTAVGRDRFPQNPSWSVVRGDAPVLQMVENGTLRLDARDSLHGVTIQTAPFKIKPLQNYRFTAQVRRIEGDMPFRLNLRWLDKEGAFLGDEYDLMGKLVGRDWEQYKIEAIAPKLAESARIHINFPGGWGAEFRDFHCLEIEPVGLRIAADLYAGQASEEKWPLILRVENRGDSVLSPCRIEIALPDGVSTDEVLTFDTGRLAYQDTFRKELMVRGIPNNLEAKLVCKVSGHSGGKPVEVVASTPVFVTRAIEKVAVSADDLPEPVLPPTDIRVGAYYFPVMLDWSRNNWGIRSVDYMKPLLGYYDEALPAVADWHIYWAATHGIEFFVFDWYWNQGMDFLNDALEKGFLQSRFKDKMKFCIDWCAEGHGVEWRMEDMSTPSMLAFMKVLCDRYFIHDNYLRVDGMPVVFLHTPTKLINTHGGWEGCAGVLEEMRALARSYGHQGVYFVAVLSNTPYLLDFQKGGFDATAPYAYGYRDVPKQKNVHGRNEIPYEATIPRHEESFATAQKEAHARGLDYIPTAWVGWDDHGRSPIDFERTPGNTPAAFRHMLEMLPRYVESDHKLALIESWNEWGEGGEVEPGIQYRFGRLSAVRDVLSKTRGQYEVFVPTVEEISRFNTDITHDGVYELYEKRHAQQYDFSVGLTLDFEQGRQSLYLQPIGGVRHLNLVDGVQSAQLLSGESGFISPPYLGLKSDTVSALQIRMKVEGGSRGRLYWTGSEMPEWSENGAVHFDVQGDGEFHEYTVQLAGHPGWSGTVERFRFHPSEKAGRVEIDYFQTMEKK
jgi:hypothetical protein